MAISRSCGGRYVTSRSPIVIDPPVGFSSPAIIRSTVDFPLPDGPTSTRNSPSAISSERSREATNPFGYVLSTCARVISAIGVSLSGASDGALSALHGASRQTLDDSSLEQEHHDRHGHRCNDGSGKDLP